MLTLINPPDIAMPVSRNSQAVSAPDGRLVAIEGRAAA